MYMFLHPCMLNSLHFPKCWNVLLSNSDFHNVLSLLVPCAPVNISTSLLCGTNELMVSWIPFAMPLNYSVSAVPLAGNKSSVTCGTIHNNCSLNGLQCGQTYNVSVRASSGSCSGPYSRPQTVQTGNNDNCNDRTTISMTCTYLVLFYAMWYPPPAPCSPRGLRAVTDCGTTSLLAFWNASLGSTSYTATVTGPNGLSETCSSSNLTCSVSGLQCASQYNVKVTSQDDHCTSSPSQIVATTGCVYIFS